MILQADAEGCVREILVVAAALSIPDPRERPTDREEAARQKHARFADEHSDFISYLNLWRYLARATKGAVGQRVSPDVPRRVPALPAHPRMAGPHRAAAQHRPRPRHQRVRRSRNPPTRRACTRRCSRACCRTSGCARASPATIQGARNAKFVLAPGSVLTKRPPRWIVVADLVETSRLYGRIAARIQPEVVERIAGDLVQRTYSEPHWDARRGAVMAFERVTLYGLPLVVAPSCRVRAVRPDSWPATCSSGTRSSRATGRPTTTSSRDNARLREELEEIEERGAPPRPARRRRRDLRLLRRAHPRRRRLGAALRRVVEASSGTRLPTCSR